MDVLVQVDHLLDVGRPAEAAQLLAPHLAERPDDPDLLAHAARVASAQGDPAEAERLAQRALQSAPEHVLARLVLYDLATDAENFATAERLIVELIRDYPASAPLLALYGRLMLRTFHLEKARALTDEALRLDPHNDTARVADALLSLVEGHTARGGERVSELVREQPDEREIAVLLLQFLIREHRYQEALRLCRELLRADPDNPALVDTIIDLRAATHWLAVPLWPMQRFEWFGSFGVWALAVGGIALMRRVASPMVTLTVSMTYLAWVIYSWAYPPLMRRYLRRAGA